MLKFGYMVATRNPTGTRRTDHTGPCAGPAPSRHGVANPLGADRIPRERLTPARIARFACPADQMQGFLWDTEAPRLAVRATRAGAKTFVFEKKLRRETVRIAIGDVAAWLLNSVWEGQGDDRREKQRGAREQANALEALVDQGIDPRAQAAEQAAAATAKREAARRSEAPRARRVGRVRCGPHGEMGRAIAARPSTRGKGGRRACSSRAPAGAR